MLEPLDHYRRDSTLFQFTTRRLRDFIDPNHLLVEIDEKFDFAKLVSLWRGITPLIMGDQLYIPRCQSEPCSSLLYITSLRSVVYALPSQKILLFVGSASSPQMTRSSTTPLSVTLSNVQVVRDSRLCFKVLIENFFVWGCFHLKCMLIQPWSRPM